MKNIILSNWTIPRILWTVIGLVIIGEAIYRRDVASIIVGLIFTGMGVLNRMCLFSSSCSVPVKGKKSKPEEPPYGKH